ncbi:MAG: hypothetical protein ACI8UP_002748 [Porticoccaceae bacterium]|jgi:hypothetical protein
MVSSKIENIMWVPPPGDHGTISLAVLQGISAADAFEKDITANVPAARTLSTGFNNFMYFPYFSEQFISCAGSTITQDMQRWRNCVEAPRASGVDHNASIVANTNTKGLLR